MFLAIINVPGYLSEQDDIPSFDTAREAWEYLADQRREHETDAWENDNTIPDGYSATVNTLEELQRGNWDHFPGASLDNDGTGLVYASTPGREDDEHDLGLVYSVEVAEDAHL
jgi:hypothetical protein